MWEQKTVSIKDKIKIKKKWIGKENIIFREVLVLISNVSIANSDHNYVTHNTSI